MATRQYSKKSAKKNTPKSTSKKKRTTQIKTQADPQISIINETKNKRKKQVGAIILFFSAILLAFILLLHGANVWTSIHDFFLGMFSYCAYLLPIIMIYIAFVTAFEKPVQSLGVKLIEMTGLIITIDSLIFVFTSTPTVEINFMSLFNSGVKFSSGGVAGVVLGYPFLSLFGKLGATITLILLSIVLIMLLFEITFVKIRDKLKEAKANEKDSEKLPEEPKAVKFKHKKPNFNINVDIDDKPVKNSGVSLNGVENSDKVEINDQNNSNKTKIELEELVNKAANLNKPLQDTEGQAAATVAPVIERRSLNVETVTGVQQKIYDYPPISMLTPSKQKGNVDVSSELKSNADRLVDTLKSFGVETRIIGICRGPAVTRYELQPSAGVKISRITSLSDDIALNLASAGVRIEAPIPNKSAVGIEVPNKSISVVKLRDVVDSEEFRTAKSKLTMAMGKDIAGNTIVSDIAKTPHMLIAGATGSGKSVCINSIIMSVLYKASPDEVKFLMVDPKVVELGIYNGIPHLLVPVVTDPGKAAGALNWAVQEMLKRYKTFAETNVRDIKGYNSLAKQSSELEKMPHIIIIIDELSDLMMAAPKDVENAICRLAQMARAAGMHLVIATQRPSVDVITGVIKANIPSRIAFAVSSQIDSRTILDMGGAEKLLGRGDMLFLPMGEAKPVRIQGCFVSDSEVEEVTNFVKTNAETKYDEDIIEEIDKQAVKSNDSSGEGDETNDGDPLLSEAIACVVEAGSASTSFLQRRLKLGYSRAARIVDQMEVRGIVGPSEGSKPRKVLISKTQLVQMQANDVEGTSEDNQI